MEFQNDIKEYYARELEAISELDVAELEKAMNCILKHYENKDTIYVIGNGGSSATANHMVCDFNKGVSLDLSKKFNVVSLSDNIPTIMAIGNDISFEDVFYVQLKGKLKPNDLIIAISGSGNSHNIIKAVNYAKEIGSEVIGMTGYDGGKLKGLSDYHMDANINDMQIVEDIHMSFNHMMMQTLWKRLMEKEGKEAVYKINK